MHSLLLFDSYDGWGIYYYLLLLLLLLLQNRLVLLLLVLLLLMVVLNQAASVQRDNVVTVDDGRDGRTVGRRFDGCGPVVTAGNAELGRKVGRRNVEGADHRDYGYRWGHERGWRGWGWCRNRRVAATTAVVGLGGATGRC